MIMKRLTKELTAAIILGVFVPSAALRIAADCVPYDAVEFTQSETTDMQTDTMDVDAEGWKIPVLLPDGFVLYMDLDTYLTGVVLAEMPAEFEEEALKAQAVVARTYALKRYATGNKHSQRAVCTDSTCCQAYKTEEEFLETGASQELLEKVRCAVLQTTGMVLTYNNALIEATYFSCSGGRTEDALAVWGADIPYLKSVSSPGEEAAAYHVDTVTFSSEEFCSLLGRSLSGIPADWIGQITYTQGGGVDTLTICGETYRGTQLRQLLKLRSTAFIITAAGNTITVTTKGYGHRVGMSQYGAEAMAVNGCTCAQILAHYYPGTLLTLWQNN